MSEQKAPAQWRRVHPVRRRQVEDALASARSVAGFDATRGATKRERDDAAALSRAIGVALATLREAEEATK